tara:strand:- start:967 stop:1365 length:399 start_codon:yes stop_codon:yes gene_type:complete
MAKEKTHARLKKDLDAVFSKYIRWLYADDLGNVECYTCGVQKPISQMQNGHFQSRKHTSTRWHEMNCKPQCVACNMFRQGEQYKFGNKLQAEYGQYTIDELINLSKSSVKYTKHELALLIEEYKEKLADLTY